MYLTIIKKEGKRNIHTHIYSRWLTYPREGVENLANLVVCKEGNWIDLVSLQLSSV